MTSRRFFKWILIGVVLALSLWLLVWGAFPSKRESSTLQISPLEFVIPTPEAYLPLERPLV